MSLLPDVNANPVDSAFYRTRNRRFRPFTSVRSKIFTPPINVEFRGNPVPLQFFAYLAQFHIRSFFQQRSYNAVEFLVVLGSSLNWLYCTAVVFGVFVTAPIVNASKIFERHFKLGPESFMAAIH